MKRWLSSVVAATVLLTLSLLPVYSLQTMGIATLSTAVTQPPKATVKTVIPDKTFTKEEVSKMNGKKGAKAYVIYKGIVYDVSKASEFKKGTYKEMKVGTDITKILSKLPKADALLKKFIPVGKLATAETVKATPPKAVPPAPTPTTDPTKPPVTPVPPTTTGTTATTSAPAPKELSLTLAELAKFNGKDGQPAYVAVDGIIYDVSALGEWTSGNHFRGIEAGKDLSEAILSSPHGKAILSRAVIVGKLK